MLQALLSALAFSVFPPMGETLEKLPIAPPVPSIEITGRLSASGVAIFDLETGQKLFARSSSYQRPMASLTKLMTALIIAENHSMDEIVRIPQNVTSVTGNVAYLPPGKHFTVGDLLSALLINSANDAASTLAQYHSGSLEAFAREMNQRALTLGMTATSFTNPSGLDNPAHWSSPEDIAWLSMFVLNNSDISDRLGRAGQRIYSREGESIALYHTHQLLHEVGPVMAGKTGTTNDAGECLMSVVRSGDHSYVVVLMQSLQRYEDMKEIIASIAPHTVPVADNSSR